MNTQSIFKAAFAITAPKVATHAPAVIDSMSTEHTQGQWDKYAASRAQVQTTTAKLAAAAQTRVDAILTRDQSEDRERPKFVVAYSQYTPDSGRWVVLRADDLMMWDDDYYTAEEATALALEREREWAGRGRPVPEA